MRTFEAGRQVQITQSTLDVLASLGQQAHARQRGAAQDQTHFLLTSVIHAGINNLPKDLSARIARALGDAPSSPTASPGALRPGATPAHPRPSLLALGTANALSTLTSAASGAAPSTAPLADWVPEEVRAQAQASGYGNSFEALRAYVPWREALFSDAGAPLYPAPRPGGPLTATVVGADGQTSGQGAGEIHTDRLGRIRIRFDFQDSTAHSQAANASNASTWVRVMQRYAGPGMGWQFIPRLAPMATPNCPTYGRSNCSRQDSWIMTIPG